jgi:hypothetical protein
MTKSNSKGQSSSTTLIDLSQQTILIGTASNNLVQGANRIESKQSIPAGFNQELNAKNKIELNTGFHANNGSIFKAEIKNTCY